MSAIKLHKYRFHDVQRTELLCPLCKEAVDDEVHFVLKCPVLNEIRAKLIPYKYYKFPCLFRLCLLLANNNEKVVRNLALYLHKAFRLREVLTS